MLMSQTTMKVGPTLAQRRYYRPDVGPTLAQPILLSEAASLCDVIYSDFLLTGAYLHDAEPKECHNEQWCLNGRVIAGGELQGLHLTESNEHHTAGQEEKCCLSDVEDHAGGDAVVLLTVKHEETADGNQRQDSDEQAKEQTL